MYLYQSIIIFLFFLCSFTFYNTLMALSSNCAKLGNPKEWAENAVCSSGLEDEATLDDLNDIDMDRSKRGSDFPKTIKELRTKMMDMEEFLKKFADKACGLTNFERNNQLETLKGMIKERTRTTLKNEDCYNEILKEKEACFGKNNFNAEKECNEEILIEKCINESMITSSDSEKYFYADGCFVCPLQNIELKISEASVRYYWGTEDVTHIVHTYSIWMFPISYSVNEKIDNSITPTSKIPAKLHPPLLKEFSFSFIWALEEKSEGDDVCAFTTRCRNNYAKEPCKDSTPLCNSAAMAANIANCDGPASGMNCAMKCAYCRTASNVSCVDSDEKSCEEKEINNKCDEKETRMKCPLSCAVCLPENKDCVNIDETLCNGEHKYECHKLEIRKSCPLSCGICRPKPPETITNNTDAGPDVRIRRKRFLPAVPLVAAAVANSVDHNEEGKRNFKEILEHYLYITHNCNENEQEVTQFIRFDGWTLAQKEKPFIYRPKMIELCTKANNKDCFQEPHAIEIADMPDYSDLTDLDAEGFAKMKSNNPKPKGWDDLLKNAGLTGMDVDLE